MGLFQGFIAVEHTSQVRSNSQLEDQTAPGQVEQVGMSAHVYHPQDTYRVALGWRDASRCYKHAVRT